MSKKKIVTLDLDQRAVELAEVVAEHMGLTLDEYVERALINVMQREPHQSPNVEG